MKYAGVAVLVLLALTVAFGLLYRSEGKWNRPAPLVDPILVTGVHNGVITLEDGRAFEPAGVEPAAWVSAEEWDAFLRTSVMQGVLVERELADGRALLRVEAKFYNWCGTSNRRWAGDYVQSGLSELAILCAYADPLATLDDLSELERWRINGASAMRFEDEPVRISEHTNAFRMCSVAFELRDLDRYIEAVTETPRP